MRLQVARYHWLLLLLIDSVPRGLTADQKKHDYRKTSSGSKSLMDAMMKKYSYPKSEVTAGVGYGHHLHPLYYRGEKEMMYPCAVECGEWETMDSDDNANDASSNVDVVTVRPDISAIEITTLKSRPYKDISFLRPKKYQSPLFSGAKTTPSTPKSTRQNFGYQDSKGADVQIIPQKANNGYLEESDPTDTPNDGSLYAKYQDASISGYEGELDTDDSEHKDNEYFDPVEESLGYNPPSFNDAESDDIEAPVYPTKIKSHPERGRIEEKYVKHNVREERLEDVRTNSFGPSGEPEDYPTDSSTGNQPNSYNPTKYIDDYAAPIKPHHFYPPNKNYQVEEFKGGFSGSESGKPFRPSPPQGQNGQRPFNNHPRNKIPGQEFSGYSDYQAEDYQAAGDDYEEPPVKSAAAYLGPMKPYEELSQGNYNKQGRNYGNKHPRGRIPPPRFRRPLIHGRHQNYPRFLGVANPHRVPYSQWSNLGYAPRFPGKLYHGSHPTSPYYDNGTGYPPYPYAPRHGYSPQSQEFPLRSSSGGIRVVPPPRIRTHSSRRGKFPYYERGVRADPYVRGQRISYRRTIPQKDGFTKIVKKYRSFVDHTPKRYVGSGEPYVAP